MPHIACGTVDCCWCYTERERERVEEWERGGERKPEVAVSNGSIHSVAIWGRRLQLLIIIVATKPNVKASIKTYARTHTHTRKKNTHSNTHTHSDRHPLAHTHPSDINSTCVISFNFIQLDCSSHCPLPSSSSPLLVLLLLLLLLLPTTRQRFSRASPGFSRWHFVRFWFAPFVSMFF